MSTGSSEGFGHGASQERSPESTSTDDQQTRAIYTRLLQQRDAQTRQSRELIQRPFDLQTYERLLEKPNIQELTPEDLPAIGLLYQKSEIPSDVFETLSYGEIASAEQMLAQGGFLDRYKPSPKELAALKLLNPDYVPSGEEFQSFLEGRHGRSADFRAWGLFDSEGKALHAIAAGFFPPKEVERLKKYIEELKSFFRGYHEEMHFTPSGTFRNEVDAFLSQAATTAEFYIIDSDVHFGGTVIYDHFSQKALADYPELTQLYLLRFGSMKMVQPLNGYSASDADNLVSRKFFKRRRFGSCGEVYMEHTDASGLKRMQLAAREGRCGNVIVVHQTWKVMRANAEEAREDSTNEMHALSSRANEARRTS